MTATYPPPLDQLLTLGEPDSGYHSSLWADYPALGLTREHIPALMEMVADQRLVRQDKTREDRDDPRFWAPVHARRALGQLRAEAAVALLVQNLLAHAFDDWVGEEVPQALGMIGPAALPMLRTALPVEARTDDPWRAIKVATALREIGVAHPETREQVVDTLYRQLRLWEHQGEDLNAFLIYLLMGLRAVESAPLMQEVYEAGAVDESILGDWEEVQVELGLLAERTTPAPRYFEDLRTTVFPDALAGPGPGAASPAARSRQLRRAQKRAKKKRR